jgi:hypothetical protein
MADPALDVADIDETVADAVVARRKSVASLRGHEVVVDTLVFDDPLGETEWHSASVNGHVVEIATHPVFPTVVRIDQNPVPTGDGLEDLAGAFALVERHLAG